MKVKWNPQTEEMFNTIIINLPQFHRNIAKQLVRMRAEELAHKRGSECVETGDLITAFFKEVPPAFKDMMKRLFANLNIDYSEFSKEEEQL